MSKEIGSVFCCDLLSMVMGKAPSGCAWVTVMGNQNSVAVATLADISCIILAEGVRADQNTLDKAEENGIEILRSLKPVFETAMLVHELLGTD